MQAQAPSILVLDENNVAVGAIDSFSISKKIMICAGSCISFGSPFIEGKVYQIKREGLSLVRVKLIRVTNPYPLDGEVFIYNDLRFLCV